MDVLIYHNPRCSKSRATLALLRERGIEPQIVEYLKDPPGRSELRKLLRLLGLRPPQLIRFNEPAAKARRLAAGDERSEDEWLDQLLAEPILLQRPVIVVDGARAALGRPPEQVLSLL